MSLSFRNEVFALCKKAQKNMAAKEISNTIMALKITKGNISSGEIPRNPHGDFAQLAEHSNNQFHGYLFVDAKLTDIAEISIAHSNFLFMVKSFLFK